jgi:hypothetical protein
MATTGIEFLGNEQIGLEGKIAAFNLLFVAVGDATRRVHFDFVKQSLSGMDDVSAEVRLQHNLQLARDLSLGFI